MSSITYGNIQPLDVAQKMRNTLKRVWRWFRG
jgi:hypothetical protein